METKGKGRRDRLSELPENVLQHIMEFIDTKYALRTSILSKRWKNLWKTHSTLSFTAKSFKSISHYNNFVYHVLSNRDASISLLNLHFEVYDLRAPKLLHNVINYAMSRYLQQLSICFCQSLTSFAIHTCSHVTALMFPKSLHIPTLKTLHLTGLSFPANDNHCADPFSNFNSLNTLILQFCLLDTHAKLLFIRNSNLSTLNLDHTLRSTSQVDTSQLKILLSTPNLTSLTIIDYVGFSYHQLSSASTLSFLQQGTIHATTNILYPVILVWLQLLTNVNILTLNFSILKTILNNLAAKRTQPLRFARLETLKVRRDPFTKISGDEVNKAMEYFFQNSSLTKDGVLSGLSADKSCLDKLLNGLSLFLD